VEDKMIKKKALITILVAGLLVFATNVFALSPGTPFTFADAVFPGATNIWTHSITTFAPSLSGSEPLKITSADLYLDLTFTPAWYDLGGGQGVYLYVGTPSLDSFYIGNTLIYGTSTPGQVNISWLALITNPSALNAIADKQAQIILTSNFGTLNNVNFSYLHGEGVVGPEPISMLLVGVGIAGLPVAGRFRRFIKKG
jgi:hypothetical protein